MSDARRHLASLLLTCVAASVGCDSPAGPVDEAGGLVQVSVGNEHSCGLAVDGSTFCWGAGQWGQLGSSSDAASNRPRRIEWNVALNQISAGSLHTCGLTADGDAYCWGVNTRGQIGNATTITQSAPVNVHSAARFTSIAAGTLHTCALDADGRVWCWGSNAQHQSGSTDAEQLLTPGRIDTALRFTAVSAGGFHTCALTIQRAVYCWGGNSLGQLGDASTRDRPAPVPVAGGFQFQSIAAGFTHTCGVTTAGAVLCWGSSLHGELGTAGIALPGLPGADTPQQITSSASFAAVSAGHHLTCALTAAGAVWCWGRGIDGQIGNGSIGDNSVPQPVRDGDLSRQLHMNQVSAGVTHTCAVSGSNVAFCWGRGDSGQLGAGDRKQTSLAIRVRTE